MKHSLFMLTFLHGRPVFPRPLPGGSTAEAIFRGWLILAQTCQKCNEIDRVWYSILARWNSHFSFHGGSAAALLNFHGGSAAVTGLQRRALSISEALLSTNRCLKILASSKYLRIWKLGLVCIRFWSISDLSLHCFKERRSKFTPQTIYIMGCHSPVRGLTALGWPPWDTGAGWAWGRLMLMPQAPGVWKVPVCVFLPSGYTDSEGFCDFARFSGEA